MQINAAERGQEIQVQISAPVPMSGITFHVPSPWWATSPLPQAARLENERLILPQLKGKATFAFKRGCPPVLGWHVQLQHWAIKRPL